MYASPTPRCALRAFAPNLVTRLPWAANVDRRNQGDWVLLALNRARHLRILCWPENTRCWVDILRHRRGAHWSVVLLHARNYGTIDEGCEQRCGYCGQDEAAEKPVTTRRLLGDSLDWQSPSATASCS